MNIKSIKNMEERTFFYKMVKWLAITIDMLVNRLHQMNRKKDCRVSNREHLNHIQKPYNFANDKTVVLSLTTQSAWAWLLTFLSSNMK